MLSSCFIGMIMYLIITGGGRILKHRIGILFVLCMLIAVFGCTAAMANSSTQQSSGQLTDSISWTLSDEGVLTIEGSGVIPDYNDVNNPSPFRSNLQIRSVVIDYRIYSIGARAFMGAANLESVTLPAGLEIIKYGAFCNTGLTEVYIPAGVDTIGESAFSGCANLTSVTIMNPATEGISIMDAFENHASGLVIHGWAGSLVEEFANQNNIAFAPVTSGQCGNNATWTFDPQTGAMTITGSGATWDYDNYYNYSPFWYNPFIRSVVISGHIDMIGDRTFAQSGNLASVTLPASLEKIGYAVFCGTGLTEVSIPAGVTLIGGTAFTDCENLASVTIMNPTVEIYDDTFEGCASGLVIHGWAGSPADEYADQNNINFVAITSGRCGDNATWTFDPQTGALTITGSGAMWDYYDYNPSPFWHNPFIRSVVIDKRIVTIGDRTFMWSGNLASVALPGGLETIGYGAFCRTGLTEVYIPAGVTVIGENAFYHCENLTWVTIMNPIVEIYGDTFVDCSSDLTLQGWLGSPVEDYAADKLIYYASINYGQCGDNATWTFNMQTGELTITGSGAMWDYYDYDPSPFWHNPFIRSVVINGHIDTVGDRAFVRSENLESVTLPASLEKIGYGAFCGTALTEVNIPAGVNIIGEIAFYDCKNLTSATIMNPIVEIYAETFKNCASGLVIHGWAGSLVQTYANQEHIAFVPITSGQCGDNAFWTFDPQTGAMTITGSGALWDYDAYDNPSPFWRNPFIRSVVIDDRIETIGARMFIRSVNLASVTLPADLKKIDYGVFCGTGLTEIYIPAGVTIIGETAFTDCGNLTRAVIMNPTVEIYGDTFEDCASGLILYGWSGSLTEEYAGEKHITFIALDSPDHQFVFPESLQEIGSEAFTDVRALSVVIPQTVTRISGNPFAGSSVLVVFGYSGTAAETFASQYGYMFVSLNSTGIER